MELIAATIVVFALFYWFVGTAPQTLVQIMLAMVWGSMLLGIVWLTGKWLLSLL